MKSHNNGPDFWVWMDLEMTGLDENTCAIIQAAMVITTPKLEEIASLDVVIWQPESVLADMVPIVKDMHTKNDLLKCVRASTTSLQEAQQQILALLTQHVPYRKGFLAGNSVYFDRRFLARYMPAVESYLHYRQLDVSSIKIVCQEWFGQRGKAPKKPSTHTALEDIKQSIDELRYYKDTLFVQP